MQPVSPPAKVEVNGNHRYIAVNDAACELLGYSRQELLGMSIEDISLPSGAHVHPMFTQFLKDGEMHGVFALRRRSGEGILIRFQSETVDGRSLATWTHFAPLNENYDFGDAELK